MVELFKYIKNNKRCWNRPKLHNKMINKVFSIIEMLYPGYLLLFLFYNIINNLVYVDNILCISGKNNDSSWNKYSCAINSLTKI